MIDRFEIVDFGSPRPDAERIVFCDGTGGGAFQEATDLELSHWRPNRTPAEYRADTSTEICYRFLDRPRPGRWTVAVNNHLDVDGILSVYVLVHSRHALAHRQTICQAADIGDFWGWGEMPAQRLFQGLTRLIDGAGDGHEAATGKAVYAEAFRRIPSLIDGTDPDAADIDQSLAPLRRGVELVERGEIVRKLLGERLAHYIIPRGIAGDDDARASYSPQFNELVSDKMLLWPEARARWDAERLCLVSTERSGGWYHDLWFPGYLWADTAGKWLVPGLAYYDGMRRYRVDNPELIAAFERLQQEEEAPGRWVLSGTPLPGADELQDQFPLAGRLVNEGRATVSRLEPQRVAEIFQTTVIPPPRTQGSREDHQQ
jgi:hypothetical protein